MAVEDGNESYCESLYEEGEMSFRHRSSKEVTTEESDDERQSFQ